VPGPRLPAVTAALGALVALSAALTGCAAAEPVPDVEPIAFDAPAAATAPGTAVAYGAPAVLPLGDSDEPVGVAVLKVVEGDDDFFDEAVTNPADFAGVTPFSVVWQYQWAADSAKPRPFLIVSTDGGTDAATLQRSEEPGTDVACPLLLPTTVEQGVDADGEVGCLVALVPTGSTVTGVRWQDTTPTTVYQLTPEESPYFAAPVVFTGEPTPAPSDDAE
jgi:hypothetical protein